MVGCNDSPVSLVFEPIGVAATPFFAAKVLQEVLLVTDKPDSIRCLFGVGSEVQSPSLGCSELSRSARSVRNVDVPVQVQGSAGGRVR
jgi:hypothetical protein